MGKRKDPDPHPDPEHCWKSPLIFAFLVAETHTTMMTQVVSIVASFESCPLAGGREASGEAGAEQAGGRQVQETPPRPHLHPTGTLIQPSCPPCLVDPT